MAMLPYCGYNMADYWQHWIDIGKRDGARLPKIFYVNWFRKNEQGGFIWPGFGENSRVLEWIFKRCDGAVDAVETPIGLLPTLDGLNLDQLGLSEDAIASLLRVDADGWMAELPLIEDYYASFGEHVPQELKEELEELKRKLEAVTVNVA